MSIGDGFKLLTDDMTPQTRKIVWRVLISLVVAVHITWACGWIPGVSGFAFADGLDIEVQRLERETVAVEDFRVLRAQIDNLEGRVESSEDKIDAMLEMSYLQMIRYWHTQLCSAGTAMDRVSIQSAIDEYERRYRDTTGREPPVSRSCS